MRMNFLRNYLAAFAVFAVLSNVFFTAESRAQNLGEEDIRNIVKEYIMDNPQVLLDSVEQYRAEQRRVQEQEAKENLKNYMSYFKRPEAPFVGKADGDVTVVEFFDYNCGYCKRALPAIQALLEKDDNVRVVFMEMPILGPSSELAARWALAAHQQGKYFEYHTALMEHRGSKTEAALKSIARDLGLDVDQMERDAQSQEIAELVDKDLEVARDLGIRGTPAFIVGEELYRGYMTDGELLNNVRKARRDN